MKVNDSVLVSPQVTHYVDWTNWAKGRIIEIEDNPYRGTVIVVRMENGDIFWDVADYFKPVNE